MSLELPVIPQLGEVFLAVNLSMVTNRSVSDTLKILEHLGYKPQLRYRQLANEIHLYALLKHEQHNPLILPDDDYLGDELGALAEVIEPSEAITSPRILAQIPKPLEASATIEKIFS